MAIAYQIDFDCRAQTLGRGRGIIPAAGLGSGCMDRMCDDAQTTQHPADTDWHRWAPIGQTLDASGVPGSGPAPSIAAFELLPFVGSISPRRHVLLEDAPLEVLAGLGPVLQRLSNATKQVPAVARCHFTRWNDGSAHLHLWAYARPAGMMQGRGAILPYWEQCLPAKPEQMMHDHIDIVATALAAGGGEAYPYR